MPKQKLRNTFWIVITLVPIIGLIFSLSDPKEFIEIRDYWRDLLAQIGIAGPLLFIVLQAIQVILPPISHYTVGVIGGFVYGPLFGGILNWIGRIIGHFIAFTLSRQYGRRIVEKFVEKDTISRFDRIVGGRKGSSIQSMILFLIYFLPLFPDDEISYIVGLSKMSRKQFILANLFGHLGGSFALAYIGSGIDTRDPYFWWLFIITFAGFPIIWFLTKRQINQTERSINNT